jgi:plastocyanin/energy-converting hydrogenase Eha subunit A
MDLLQQIWDGILNLTKLLVIPDWGGLILLLPVFVGVLVVLFVIWLIVQYRRVGPRRRRPGRVTPKAPAGLHMPGPTYAPILAAFGTFLLFLGIVFPGPLLLLGVVAIVLALLFWGRESFGDYDHVAETYPQLPAVVHDGPPPGVHIPGPTFRPILAAIGTFLVLLGLVFPGPLLAVGVLFFIVAMLGWLNDARKEYIRTVAADRTGHLENGPDPRWPKALAWTFGVLTVFAVLATAGLFPPHTAVGGEAGGSPTAGSPAPSGAPGQLKITAKNVAFDQKTMSAPADKAFQVLFDNQDANINHDWDVLDASGKKVVDNKDFQGVAQKTYDIPALKAGTYKFECSIHPAQMNGTLTVGS